MGLKAPFRKEFVAIVSPKKFHKRNFFSGCVFAPEKAVGDLNVRRVVVCAAFFIAVPDENVDRLELVVMS